MAYILDENDEQQGQSQSQAQSPLVSGGQSAQVSGGGGTSTGAGRGGTGGFVNLQSYLNANTGDTGGASALKSTVGDEFNKEKSNLTENSTKYVQDAQKQVADSSINNDQADSLINNSALLYDYGGSQKADYKQNVDKVRGALTNPYSGPREYSYGIGAKTQEYGNALSDDEFFKGLMGDIYSQRAGQPLSSGQRNLQSQLDVHNTALADTRKNLSGDYAGLSTLRDETVKNTTDQLAGLEKQYRTNQNALRDYLGLQANTYDTKRAQAEADARAAYQQSYRGDLTGRTNAVQASGVAADPAWYTARGVWGTNLTPEQLQREQDMRVAAPHERGSYQFVDQNPNSLPAWDVLNQTFHGNRSALDSFYTAQDQKYANTADTEKRSYNAIQDFLNSEAERRQAGFQVRK